MTDYAEVDLEAVEERLIAAILAATPWPLGYWALFVCTCGNQEYCTPGSAPPPCSNECAPGARMFQVEPFDRTRLLPRHITVTDPFTKKGERVVFVAHVGWVSARHEGFWRDAVAWCSWALDPSE